MPVNPTLKDIHYKALGNSNFESILEVLWGDLKPLEDFPNYKAKVINPYKLKDQRKQASWTNSSVGRSRNFPERPSAVGRTQAGKHKRDRNRLWAQRFTGGRKRVPVHPGGAFTSRHA